MRGDSIRFSLLKLRRTFVLEVTGTRTRSNGRITSHRCLLCHPVSRNTSHRCISCHQVLIHQSRRILDELEATVTRTHGRIRGFILDELEATVFRTRSNGRIRGLRTSHRCLLCHPVSRNTASSLENIPLLLIQSIAQCFEVRGFNWLKLLKRDIFRCISPEKGFDTQHSSIFSNKVSI